MRRNTQTFEIKDLSEFINKVLSWCDNFSHFAYFNPNGFEYPNDPFKHFIAAGVKQELKFSTETFENLEDSLISNNDYIIGHLSYDLKNQLEKLKSENKDSINAPDSSFFIPITIIKFNEQSIEIESHEEPADIFKEIQEQSMIEKSFNELEFYPICSKERYLSNVKKLQKHIIDGDIYEINYCHEYQADGRLDPINTYLKLIKSAPSPFSVLYKSNDIYTICGSPERFIKKQGNRLITQPIKGTSKRSSDPFEDEKLKNRLRNDEKELAENMMIVDLCRNDLAKSCIPGSVKVDEMFGIYSFPFWHQMISTVSGELLPRVNAVQAIQNAFPMGSMTGAPKIKVMELAEKYEVSKRGIYSGTIGYFLPNGDFDFNVVIRSIIHNKSTSKSSFMVGGAITYDSIPEEEYEECLTKAKTLTSLFKITSEN